MAKREFREATRRTNHGRANIAGHLALASVQYTTGQYSEALKNYQTALKKHPQCPAEVRLGIGACYFKLGDLNRAQAAFERVRDCVKQ